MIEQIGIYYIPLSKGWFHVEATRRRHRPRRPRREWCERDNPKDTGWIILKFGIHTGSYNAPSWMTF